MNNTTLEELVAQINDGDTLAIPTVLGDFSGSAMAATREIIRQGRKGLNLVCVPGGSLQADMLIGAGCVASLQAGTISLYEHGAAPRFVDAQRRGELLVKEATCPAIEAGLSAAERGVPFMPVRGIIGSDVYRLRSTEWKTIDNPFGNDDPIVLIPVLQPDVALFHAPLADDRGNAWVGRRGSIDLMARAAKRTLVTFEDRYDGCFFDDPDKSSGVLASMFISGLSHQPNGAWPYSAGAAHPEDTAHIKRYAELAKTREGFTAYLQEFVYGRKAA